jgi:hypothetical protein
LRPYISAGAAGRIIKLSAIIPGRRV